MQITSPNRNEPFYLHTAHKSNAVDQGPDCWGMFIPFKARDKFMKGLERQGKLEDALILDIPPEKGQLWSSGEFLGLYQ